MGLFDFLKKKKPLPAIIFEEDANKLKEMERKAYMEEAEKLILIRGKERAKAELGIKKPDWEIN